MSEAKKPIRFRKRLSLLVAVLLSIVITFIIVKKSSVLPTQLNRYVNEHYLKDSNFRFSCGSVSGNLVNTVTLKNVRLRYSDQDVEFDLFRSKHLTLDYSIFEVLKLNLIINQLTVDNTNIRLIQNSAGEFLIPGFGNTDTEPGALPNIVIKQYTINNVDFLYRDSTRTIDIDKINLAGNLRLQNNEGFFEIDKGNAYLPATDTQLQSLRFAASYVDDLMSLDNLVIRLDRSYIMASGKYLDGSVRHLQFVFNPLDLQEISSLGLIPENNGEVGGNLTISGTLDTLNIHGSITGKASGLVFSGFSFDGMKTGPVIEFSELEGTVYGSYIKGLFRYYTGDRGGYLFDGTCRGLDISEGFISSDGIPETDLYGRVKMEYRRRSDSYHFSAFLDTSSVQKFRSERLRFDGQWSGVSGLTVNRVEFDTPGFTLAGSGSITPAPEIDLILNLHGHDLSALWEYLKLPQIDSWVSVNGRMAGPADDLQINLNGSLKNAAFLFTAIDTGEIQAEIKHISSKNIIAKIDLQGQHIDLAGTEFSDPHIALEALSGSVDVTDLSFANGDTFITTDFQIVPEEQDQEILFKHLVVKMPSETWSMQAPAPLHLRSGTAVLDTLTLSSRDGSIRFAGTYEETEGRFDIHAEGREVQASLLRRSLGIPWKLEGKSRFIADLNGILEKSNMRVEFALGPGSLRGVPLDGIRFVCRYDSSGYTIDDLLIASKRDSLRGNGEWRLPLSPLQLAREIDRDEEMMRSPWKFNFAGRNFPLSTVFGVLDKEPPVNAAYTGSFTIGGTPGNSRFAARGVLGAVKESSVHFPDMNLAVIYEDSLLDITSITFDDGKMRGTIDGRMPAVFSITEGFRLRTRSPFTLNSSIESNDLSVLASYLDAVDLAKGSLRSSLNAHGTLDDPRFSGNLDFQDCTIRLTGMEELYNKVTGRVTILDNMVQLSALSGRVGKKGTFHGSGFAELKSFKPVRYRVDCTMENFLFTSVHDFLSLHDGTISLSSLGTGDHALTPVVTGNLKVKQATITKSLASESDGTPSALMMPSEHPSWFCDLDIEAPKKIFIKNPGLNMELGGNVILKRDKSGLYLRGELNVLRGSYTLYNNKFTITDGLFNFSAATAMRPEIDLNAYSLYRMGDEEHRIFLNLSWPTDKKEPQVTLSSDTPGYSETDIWKMLGGTYVATGRSESGWDAAGTAQNIAGNYLEGVLNAQMHDLTIDVESRALNGSDGARRPEREMTIAIGKYLSEDLYLKYRQGLSISSEREVDIEYRIGTMVILRSEIIRHSSRQLLGKSSQATDEINFDIKLRFEY